MVAADPSVASLEAVWPLFQLRIRSAQLVLRLPTDDDLAPLLAVAKSGIHPPGEMPFGVAWTAVEGPAFDHGFLAHHWEGRAAWSVDDWRLNLMVEMDGRPIGSQTVVGRGFPILRTVETGSWLGRAFQRRGLGKEMRSAVLAFAFDGLGARFADSAAFLDNAASNAVSRGLGYDENGRGSLAPEGVARETQKFRMSADSWRSRPRPSVTIDGLDVCREMFAI
ncbi:MAG: GNAT family N-acetyltransferase [Chloroflexota bacterium]